MPPVPSKNGHSPVYERLLATGFKDPWATANNRLNGVPEPDPIVYPHAEDLTGIDQRISNAEKLDGLMQPVPPEWQIPAEKKAAGGSSLIYLISLSPPKLGAAAYWGFIGEFLRAVAPYTEATDAGVLAHLLPAVGCMIGPGPHVWGGNKQPARINTALVGPTSTGRKGTSLVAVDLLMKRIDAQFWDKQQVRGLSSGEGLIAAVSDKVTTDDDGNKVLEPVEKRLYVIEPEFSKILMQTRREGNILSQIIREAYDSGNFGVLTRNPLHACDAHVCITGHITPEELKRRMDAVEMANGFGNRILWFAVKSDKVMPCAPRIPDALIAGFAGRLRMILAGAANQQEATLDPDAKGLWLNVYPSLRNERPGFAGCLTARGESIVLRLALIYALLDASTSIRLEHLQAGLAVWQYNEESVQMLFKNKSGSKLADSLYELLANGPMKTTEFYSHVAQKAEDIHAVLAQLEHNEQIRKVKIEHNGPGRPAEQWERVW